MNSHCICAGFVPDIFLARAVQQATRSYMEGPGALTTIRNGGTEHSFRNKLLEAAEERPPVIGFAEASDRAVSRIDLAYRCQRCGDLLLAVETKSNFSVQVRQARGRCIDACLQLEPLFRREVPGYLAYAVTEQYWYGPQSELVRAHNAWAPSYKRMIDGTVPESPSAEPFAQITPLTTIQRTFEKHRARLRVQVWLARCSIEGGDGIQLQFLNEHGHPIGIHAVGAEELERRRASRKRKVERLAQLI